MIVIILLLLLFATNAEATIYWVQASGGTTGNCGNAIGSSDPGLYLRQITDAVACIGTSQGAGAGHTIRVKSGTYSRLGELPSGTSWNNPFTLESASGASVVVQGAVGAPGLYMNRGEASQNNGDWHSYPWFLHIKGTPTNKFKFTNAGTGDSNAIEINGGREIRMTDVETTGYDGNTAHISAGRSGFNCMNLAGTRYELVRLYVHHCDNRDIGTYGIYWGGVNDSTMVDSVLHDMGGYAVHGYNGGPSGPPQTARIERNLFYNCGQTAGNGGFTPCVILGGTNMLLANNVLYNSTGNGVDVSAGGNQNKVFNNTIVQNGGSPDAQYCVSVRNASNTEVRNNICYLNENETINEDNAPGTITSNNSLGVNPQFANISARNFQLTTSTPVSIRQGGTALSSFFFNDANGVTRSTSTWGLGACYSPSGGGNACPVPSVGQPQPSASVSITSPFSGARGIQTDNTILMSGSASCTSGTPSVTWSNNQGGNGTAVGTTSWAMTGSGAVLTPDQYNTFTITNTCSGGGPTAQTTQTIAYSPRVSIAEYSLDENSGSAPQDATGNGNHGTFGAGVAYTATDQKYGASGLDFSGGSVSVTSTQLSTKIIGGFTIVAWARPDAVYTNFRAIAVNNYSQFLYGTTSGTQGCPSGVPLGGFTSGAATFVVCGSVATALPVSPHSCVAVTYNGATLDLYINSVLVGSSNRTYEFPIVPATGTFQIGNSTFSEPFDGKIDEVRITKYGMTSAEVATACDTQIGTAPPAPASSLTIGTVGFKIGDKTLTIGF